MTQELLAEGLTHNDLARQTRSGKLVHVRRGAYDSRAGVQLSVGAEHQRLVEATTRLTASEAVVSHSSAAACHGLPVFANRLDRVHVTRPDVPGGKRRRLLQVHAAQLDPSEVVEVTGVRVTSLARTVIDLSRLLPFDEAVMVGDAALRMGLLPADLELCLSGSIRRPGMANARRTARFIDGLSESAGESLSRVALDLAGVPAPTLQHEVRDGSGHLLGRADFYWEEHRTIGEFDGRIKYGRLLRPGEKPEDVVYREKLREDSFRDHGYQVARWVWAEIATPEVIAERLTRAFHRNGRLPW